MPAFFVHGVPDTASLWDRVREHLGRGDVIAPSMPGFSAPIPEGFDATNNAYATWIIERIEEVGEPVDLVGHDWGSRLAQRIVFLRRDLIRTWCVGGAAQDREYEWHPTAKTWQTPEAGEQLMESMTPDAITGLLSQQGIDEPMAREVASRVDGTMKDCILKLYRSATDVATDWDELRGDYGPGLVLWGANDAFSPPEFGKRLAERTGATNVTFDDCGHWWPYERPKEVAALLTQHWAR